MNLNLMLLSRRPTCVSIRCYEYFEKIALEIDRFNDPVAFEVATQY